MLGLKLLFVFLIFFIQNFHCPSVTENGGPIISIKANPKNNQVTLVWESIDTQRSSIDFYQLIINDEKKQIVN